MGNELDLNEGDTVVYLMKYDDNKHCWLVENGKGQVGYVPAAYLMIIMDETRQEEESDTERKEVHEKRTDGTNIGGEMGQDGQTRKKYSAAVIDGIKIKSRIFVGDSIVRKTDSRLRKGEDVVVCLPGARIEHVTERIYREDHGKRKWRVHTSTRRDEQRRQGRNNCNSGEVQETTEEDEASKDWIDNLIRNFTSVSFGDRIHAYRNSKRMADNGMVKRLCKEEEVGYVDLWDSFVGKEEMYMRDGLHLSGKEAAVFAEGLSGAVASGLGKVSYLN